MFALREFGRNTQRAICLLMSLVIMGTTLALAQTKRKRSCTTDTVLRSSSCSKPQIILRPDNER
jgi:hypothetical protein